MPVKINLDPEEIRRLYQDEGYVQREIAARFDCSIEVIRRHMKEYNIPRTQTTKFKFDPNLVHKLYWDEELCLKDTAEKLGCHKLTLLHFMQRHNIPRRNKGGRTDLEISPEELRHLYQDKKLSMQAIADLYDSTQAIVRKRMIKFGIPRDKLAPKGTSENFRGFNWKQIKLAVLKRDNYTCQVHGCESKERPAVHHIIPWKVSEDNQMDNLITLCNKHHKAVEYQLPWLMLAMFNGSQNMIKDTLQSLIINWAESESILGV